MGFQWDFNGNFMGFQWDLNGSSMACSQQWGIDQRLPPKKMRICHDLSRKCRDVHQQT
jgi:hypothetical protein